MSEGNSPQVWRVECDDGVREVTLLRNGHGSLVVRAPMHVDAAVATEREEGGKLCDLCAQFARVMGDPHAEEYEKLAAAIRAGSRALLPLEVSRGA